MNLLTQLSKYLFIFLILLFTLKDYTYMARKDERRKRSILSSQFRILCFMTILGYLIIYLHTQEIRVLVLLGGILVYDIVTTACYRLIYPLSSMLLVNNMLMLLAIGFIMILRLDFDQAFKQFMIAAAGTIIAFIIPVIIRKLKILSRLTWLYAIIGLFALMGVLALAAVSGGAKLSVSVGGVTIQFSELVKITFVFFLAAKLARDLSKKSILTATAVAALHVLILVMSTDLGTALVFFIAYIVMIFVATRKLRYPLAGLTGGSLAAVGAYFVFNHVKQRVVAWKDPFKVYNTSGYQIVQGLFAIGAGGWFGTGLMMGSPKTIPVATKDFIFAAICEEFGTIFGICLILNCMSMFILIVNISMLIRNRFYKLVAIGLGTEYAFQVFLTIGGVTKFIPMTGITLPLVSYGGSSVISTIIMLAIIQGLYILREDEGEEAFETNNRPSGHGKRDRQRHPEHLKR
jgi:cell division protein FtsW (lipid II flippase)